MKLYMKVSRDEYELPLAVAESVVELSRMVGYSTDTISAILSKVRNKKSKYHSGFREVELVFDFDKFLEKYNETSDKKALRMEVGCSATAIQDWRHGRGCPAYTQILAMEKFFGVEPDYFFKEDEQDEKINTISEA